VLKAESALTERVAGTTATLRAIRVAELQLLKSYTDAIELAEGLANRALRKALGRTLVLCHLLTAHIAKRTGNRREADVLPEPLARYFAGPEAKACMRCHLDRPGAWPALERRDPPPYTYVCAGCHAEVRGEFPPDLALQIDRWPARVQEARVLQHAIGRPSVLNAVHKVLHPLSGLAEGLPAPAAEKAIDMPAVASAPCPRPDERPAVLTAEPHSEGEASYVRALFDYRTVCSSW
jgi:hypothetical protein